MVRPKAFDRSRPEYYKKNFDLQPFGAEGNGNSSTNVRHDTKHQPPSKSANENVIIPVDVENKMVPIVLNVGNVEFLLLQVDATDKKLHDLTPLFDNASILNCSIAQLFDIIRTDDDLVELHRFTEFDELVLQIDELDSITITEDNIYCRNILINDFTKVLNALKFKTTGGATLSVLHFKITSQDRFITNFNNLNDLIRLGYGLERIGYRKRLFKSLVGEDSPHKDDTIKRPGLIDNNSVVSGSTRASSGSIMSSGSTSSGSISTVPEVLPDSSRQIRKRSTSPSPLSDSNVKKSKIPEET